MILKDLKWFKNKLFSKRTIIKLTLSAIIAKVMNIYPNFALKHILNLINSSSY
jgi:hypothetical protein